MRKPSSVTCRATHVEALARRALQGVLVEKSQPTGSDLHVPVLLGAQRRRVRRVGKAADQILATVFGQAMPLAESLARKVAKDGIRPVRASVAKLNQKPGMMPIVEKKAARQLAFCVVLEPGVVDTHDEVISADEIERTAHAFLANYRFIGSMHERKIDAVPVESFLAPQDLLYETGTYGRQVVSKGSWVLGVYVRDPDEWGKIVSGHYSGFSVGGFADHVDDLEHGD